MKIKKQLDRLIQHRHDFGLEGLLPQNLPEALLIAIFEESEAIKAQSKETPASLSLTIILMFKSGADLPKIGTVEIEYDTEQMMADFAIYHTNIILEMMRRFKDVKIADNQLPSLDNIFDSKRKISIITPDC